MDSKQRRRLVSPILCTPLVVPSSPASSPPSATALLLLHDSHLLLAIALHVPHKPVLTSLSALSRRTCWWLESLTLRMRRPTRYPPATEVLSLRTAKALVLSLLIPETLALRPKIASLRTLRRSTTHATHHPLHELFLRHPLPKHLHHLLLARHTGHSSSRTSSSSPHATTRGRTTTKHGLHRLILLLLLLDCPHHCLLPYRVLRPRELVEAVVEEVRLVGPR